MDRTKRFYRSTLGWRLDADYTAGEDFRVVRQDGILRTPIQSGSRVLSA